MGHKPLTLIERAITNLTLVAEYWPGLAETRIPGTPPPYREPSITPERRAELDYQARAERVERHEIAPGEHVDAVRPEVLDLLAGLLIDADDIAELVARAVMCPRLEPPSTAFADPGPWLSFAVRHLPSAGRHRVVVEHVAEVSGRMLGEVSRALSLMHDGQRLRVVCPWCGGGLAGERTWRVRQLPGDEVAIVCESGMCDPPSRDVGTWWRGLPCWPIREWDWLAKRLNAAEKQPAGVV
jgi:hypothetical protein